MKYSVRVIRGCHHDVWMWMSLCVCLVRCGGVWVRVCTMTRTQDQLWYLSACCSRGLGLFTESNGYDRQVFLRNSHEFNFDGRAVTSLPGLLGNLPVVRWRSGLLPWCLCVCTPAPLLERHGRRKPCWVIDNWLGSFMMELSALLCRILLAVALLTFAVTHQNANSLSSFLNWVLSGKIRTTGLILAVSVLPRQKKWWSEHRSWLYTCTLVECVSEGFSRKFRWKTRILWPPVASKAFRWQTEDADLLRDKGADLLRHVWYF